MKIPFNLSFNNRLNTKINVIVKYAVYLAFSLLVLITIAHFVQKAFNYCVKKYNETPAKFKNHITVRPLMYTADSLYLSHILKQMNDEKIRKTHEQGSTIIIIDTIIYDSTFNKLSFWALHQTTNPDFRASSYIYSGSGYYAFRNSTINKLNVSAYSEKLDSCPSYDKIRTLLETRFFYELAKNNKKKNQKPGYNWDDIRLWNGALADSVADKNSFTLNNKEILVINPSLTSILAKQKEVPLKKSHSKKLKKKKKKS